MPIIILEKINVGCIIVVFSHSILTVSSTIIILNKSEGELDLFFVYSLATLLVCVCVSDVCVHFACSFVLIEFINFQIKVDDKNYTTHVCAFAAFTRAHLVSG